MYVYAVFVCIHVACVFVCIRLLRVSMEVDVSIFFFGLCEHLSECVRCVYMLLLMNVRLLLINVRAYPCVRAAEYVLCMCVLSMY